MVLLCKNIFIFFFVNQASEITRVIESHKKVYKSMLHKMFSPKDIAYYDVHFYCILFNTLIFLNIFRKC